MTRPRWLDEHGKAMASRPCHRCGTPVPVGRTLRLEHMRMIGWQLFAEAQIIQRYGHAQRFLVVPHADGVRAALVPLFREGM